MLNNPKWDGKLFDLDKPSLTALSYLLRNQEKWPTGFVWDYSFCDQCAMGLARTLWEKDYNSNVDSVGRAIKYMSNTFGLSIKSIEDIFKGTGWADKKLETVTPEMVADRIDKFLVEYA